MAQGYRVGSHMGHCPQCGARELEQFEVRQAQHTGGAIAGTGCSLFFLGFPFLLLGIGFLMIPVGLVMLIVGAFMPTSRLVSVSRSCRVCGNRWMV